MVTRVTGAPAIQEPRAGVAGGPTIDLRSTQVAIQNIRERFRRLEAALNTLVVPEEATTSSSSSGNAGGPPGAIQYTDAGGGFAGSLSLTWSATNQELTVVGDTYFYGDLYQNGSLLTFVTGIYADGVEHVGLVNLVAGSGITLAALTGNVIEISSAASAGVNSLNSLQGNITLQAGSGVSIVTLTGNVIEVSASASAGVSSLNTLTGAVTIQGDSSVSVTILTGNVIQLSATGGSSTSISAGLGITVTPLTGSAVEVAANLVAGANITLTPLTGNVLEVGLSGNIEVLEAIVGDPGTEASGISISGVTFESTFKVSDIAGTNYAQTILHRHSTTLEPLIVGARSNSDTSSHADVVAGQNLFTIYAVGWAGLSYKLAGSIRLAADTGTVSETSLPGKVVIATTPDGAVFPVDRLEIDEAGVATFAGYIVAPAATTSIPSIRLPHGAAPSSPTNGDLWTTTAGLYVRINGSTVGPLGTGGGGGGVSSLNTLTGPVTIQGDGTVGVTILSGNVIELSASASSGVTSLNYLTGPVTIRGEGGITVGFGTGNVIELRATIFSRGSAPPDGALPGDRWVQDDTGILFTYYDDGDTSQWVDFSNVSSGGSSLPLPVAIESGGTGQVSASAAINALLPSQTGNSGEVLTTNGTAASWATLSSLNPTFTDYTPTDQSGAALSFSAADGRYVKIGKMVWFWATVTYPVTSDVSNAAISLPSTTGASINAGITIAQSSVTAAKGGVALAGQAKFFIYGELVRTNADLSGATLFVTGFYEEA